ncbi:hypothetical protein [Rhizocola hellebori]|nr:hypothetical protein [Rhizocola hellebori]
MRKLAMVAAAAIVVSGCVRADADRSHGPASTSSTEASPSADPSGVPVSTASPSPAGVAVSPAVSPARTSTAAPSRFATLQPGARLPAGDQCAGWVRARPKKENKGVNRAANSVTGQHVDASTFGGGAGLAKRVDGQFTGTTEEILRWAACKWGIDEDLVKAQAAIESWWRQDTLGDFGTDAGACPEGHGLGADGQAGKCPQSYGILQNRYPYMKTAFPGAMRSTAMSADLAYGIWRICMEGHETWLNTVERGQQYAAGDAWGCVGRWFSGRWHTEASEQYVGRVKDYLNQRIWETPNFQQP